MEYVLEKMKDHLRYSCSIASSGGAVDWPSVHAKVCRVSASLVPTCSRQAKDAETTVY
jgi:hypothetical protein